MNEVERLKDAKEQERYDYLNNRQKLFHAHTLFDGFPTAGYQIDIVIEKMTEFRNQLAKREVDIEDVDIAMYNSDDPHNLSIDVCWDEYETEEEYNERITAEAEEITKENIRKYKELKKTVLSNYDAVCNIIEEEKLKRTKKYDGISNYGS